MENNSTGHKQLAEQDLGFQVTNDTIKEAFSMAGIHATKKSSQETHAIFYMRKKRSNDFNE